jgi:LmbE family N-acetylglucosaminyl deacetylase
MDLILTISRSLVLGLIGILCVSASLRLETTAQVAPVYDRGVMGLAQMLKRLNTSASAMMIGAHPDDEDTALLAYLARGENARTAYLSLTRGDGGQNIIGPELGEALGVIRTEELLQARRLDGAEQYFTRAYDYGFSKTLAEAQQKWPEPIVLCDAVRAIREFRPLVIISQFSGTPADGHGQHQYAGYIAPIAVKAAGDATQCRDSGPAWNVQKFFVRQGFRATGEPQLKINTGKFDPILGRSYFEIAMEARSQHKSQEQGVLELKGEMFSGLNSVGENTGDKEIFQGIDQKVSAIADHSGETNPTFLAALNRAETAAKLAIDEYNVRRPELLLLRLVVGLLATEEAVRTASNPASRALAEVKSREFRNAIKKAAGIQIDALSATETIIPLGDLNVSVRVFAPPISGVTIKDAVFKGPQSWKVEVKAPAAETATAGNTRRERADLSRDFIVKIPFATLESVPYWLRRPREGALFHWPDGPEQTHPFKKPIAHAAVSVEIAGKTIEFEEPIEYRFADDVRGEVRRSVNVVLPLTLAVDRPLIIFPSSQNERSLSATVTVTSNTDKPVDAVLSLTPNDPGKIKSSERKNISLRRKGEKVTVPFSFEIPPGTAPGKYRLVARAETVADDIEVAYLSTETTLAYPHITTHRLYTDTVADIRVLDVSTSNVNIGYIAGSGDRIPDAIRELGLAVQTITPAELASGDLSKYDTIIVGIRAYQVRPDLASNNKRLLDFANTGGTLIVQYQLPGYTQQNLAPFPAQQGPRTSDENAAVNILVPDHPIMNSPNKLSATDFEGWVQERNLYNFSAMDAKYVGLLESHDAGEVENKGGLVVADVGKGKYIYCSYSLFRQLPAGVPGAYRLLANMISLPKTKY